MDAHNALRPVDEKISPPTSPLNLPGQGSVAPTGTAASPSASPYVQPLTQAIAASVKRKVRTGMFFGSYDSKRQPR